MAIKSLKVVGLGSKNVDKLFAAGFQDIFELIEVARSKNTARKRITEIPGFGESMLSTIGVGIPKALSKLDIPELMEMSGVFVQPGLALAKVSFDKIYAATKGKCDSTSEQVKVLKAVGPAKGKLFISKYPEWKRWYSKLKSFKD